MADGAQPQLDPQHPVPLLLAGQRQALVDHVSQALRAIGPRVAGTIERVRERLCE